MLSSTASAQIGLPSCPTAGGSNQFWWSDYIQDPSHQILTNGIKIEATDTVYLDSSSLDLEFLWVEGNLVYDPCFPSLEISAACILIDEGGRLQMGSASYPVPANATATLTLSATAPLPTQFELTSLQSMTTDQDALDALTSRGLVVAGGTLLMFGDDSAGVSWGKLSSTLPSGATQMTAPANAQWTAGDEILFTPTDFQHTTDETRTLSLAGATLDWTQPLGHQHYADATPQNFASPPGTDPAWDIQEQGEAAILNRNVLLQGEADALNQYGHIMLMRGSQGDAPLLEASWAAFRDLGNEGQSGRYPLHFHQLDNLQGLPATFVRDCLLQGGHNNGFVIHGTTEVELSRNVVYDCGGYSIYLQTGAQDTLIQDNLMVGGALNEACCASAGNIGAGMRLSDLRNTVTGNVACGYRDYGFYLVPPDDVDLGGVGLFQDNEAHSIHGIGFFQDTRGKTPGMIYERLFAWKCREYGCWLRSHVDYELKDSRFADCRAGFYPASKGRRDAGVGHQVVSGCLFVGETANLGEVDSAKNWEVNTGRSQAQDDRYFPNHDLEWDTLAGIEIYDGFLEVQDCRFAALQDTDFQAGEGVRQAAGLTQVAKYSNWAIDPRNSVEMLEFSQVDRTAYFRDALSQENQIAFLVIHDKDGSLGYGVDQRLFPNTDFLTAFTTATFHADAPGAPGLNGYSQPVAGHSWGQVFLTIDDPACTLAQCPTTKWIRVDDPGGAAIDGPEWLAESVPTEPSAGGDNHLHYPLNLETEPFGGTTPNLHYYKVSYPQAPGNQAPTDFTLEVRFNDQVGDLVFVEVPYFGVIPLVDGADQLLSVADVLSSTSSQSEWAIDSTNKFLLFRLVSAVPQGLSLYPAGCEKIVGVN